MARLIQTLLASMRAAPSVVQNLEAKLPQQSPYVDKAVKKIPVQTTALPKQGMLSMVRLCVIELTSWKIRVLPCRLSRVWR
jgi:hypothetical protein